MMRNSIQIVLAVLFSIQLSHRLVLAQRFVRCAYFGEPHLIPFPTTFGGLQNTYLCLTSGSQVLISNSFITISVTIAPTGGHPIISYSLFVNALPGLGFPSSCNINGNLGTPFSPLTCPPGSPATANVVGSTLHVVHPSQNIYVDIYFQGGFFDIYVAQPFALIAKSKGVCVKHNCTLQSGGKRKKRQQVSPVISNICERFISAALAQTSNPISSDVIQSARDTCVYDINTALDARYGRATVVAIIRGGISQNPGDLGYQDALFAADNTIQSVYCQTAPQVNNLIAQSPPVCNNNNGQTQCLGPIDVASQCSGK